MNAICNGKSVIVTGATRGIGFAIAKEFVEAGALVIATGTSVSGKPPAGCHYEVVDFLEPGSLDRFTKLIEKQSPDILINNAGINKIGEFENLLQEDFEKIQQVNVNVPFQLCRAVIPGMRAKNWGRIINIGSIWGKISKELRAPYSTSKFALDGMTAALAAEVAKYGILANCIAPGFIDTELTRSVLKPDQIDEIVKQVPIRRLGTPIEIAKFTVWLASPENTFISGQNIAIDGGFTRV
ncbi:MAG: SDR family oxidoreductase [Desulfamplus sp.]|nr:SDR family oxidoreductase [Desulfamplus sp.]